MEVAFGAVLVAAALVTAALRPRWHLSTTSPDRPVERVMPDGGPDLPCPWCAAPTTEDDRSCPACRQRFG
jgi:hypothetical protein